MVQRAVRERQRAGAQAVDALGALVEGQRGELGVVARPGEHEMPVEIAGLQVARAGRDQRPREGRDEQPGALVDLLGIGAQGGGHGRDRGQAVLARSDRDEDRVRDAGALVAQLGDAALELALDQRAQPRRSGVRLAQRVVDGRHWVSLGMQGFSVWRGAYGAGSDGGCTRIPDPPLGLRPLHRRRGRARQVRDLRRDGGPPAARGRRSGRDGGRHGGDRGAGARPRVDRRQRRVRAQRAGEGRARHGPRLLRQGAHGRRVLLQEGGRGLLRLGHAHAGAAEALLGGVLERRAAPGARGDRRGLAALARGPRAPVLLRRRQQPAGRVPGRGAGTRSSRRPTSSTRTCAR